MEQTKPKISIVRILFLFLVIIGSNLKAQLAVSPGGTAQQLAELISGQGVQILNPIINCPTNGYGTYNASVVNFQSEEGLILATGKITNAVGPNNTESKTTDFNAPGNSLLTTISGFETYDGCVFEFDIIPQGDSLKFNFTFASEEYQEYVGTPFNDVFGFLISGPGIVGDPGLGVNKNIAVLPGTNIPVTVNEINNGNPNLFPPYPATNPNYFVPNPLNPTAQIQYDGWTKDLFAEVADLEACQTYHLILSIADASDEFWDAAVFIEKIESNGIFVTTSTDAGIDNMIEGCNNGTITFTRTNVTSLPQLVTYYIAGTASNSIDYPLIGGNPNIFTPKFAVIPPNEASKTIQVFPVDDNIAEGLEYITIYIGNPFCEGAKTDSTNFFIQDSLTVIVNPPFAQICPGTSLTLDAEGDGGSYSWSPPIFLNNPNIEDPTTTPTTSVTYVVTNTLSSDFGACVATDTSVITISTLSGSGIVSNINCNGGNTGSINVTVTGGQGPYLYAWTGPNGSLPSTQDQNNLIAGNYTVVITDDLGCRVTLNFVITAVPQLSATISAITYIGGKNVSCNGAADGSISVSVSGGTSPYSYQWNTVPVQTGSTASGLTAGSYSVLITDANGCTIIKNKTLTQPAPLSATISGQVNVNCAGQATGSATVVASGGTAPYTYLWNTIPTQTTATATNLIAGTYSVTVKDVNNCTKVATVTITSNNVPLVITTTKTNVRCNGLSNGTATANVVGGTNPITYSWNTIPVQTTQTATGLSAGNYVVNIVDANGCTGSATVTITQPNILTLSITQQINITCGNLNSGAATVQAAGGTGPYTYSWNTIPIVNGNSITNVTAGSYTVTVVDSKNCTAQLVVNILTIPSTLNGSVTSSTNVNCFGANSGTATVQGSGGTPLYSYSWNTSPIQTGATAINLVAGNYIVTITDNAGCTFLLPVTITQPTTALQANISTIQNVLCFGASTGSATVVASNGTSPYTYQWNDPLNQTTSTATNLPAGNYAVIVTDAKGCIVTVNVTISQPASTLSAIISSISDADCSGNSNGSATVVASGGSGSYSYLWNSSPAQTTATATNLAPGNYTVTVTDNNGCANPIILNVTINQISNSLNASIVATEVFGGPFNLACNGDTNATITSNVSGGTPPFIYLWTLPDLSTELTPNLVNVGAGTYILEITDSNNCVFNGTISIQEPAVIEIIANPTAADCFGANSGSIDVSINGGVTDYTYNWDGPNSFSSTDEDIFNLFGGSYNLVVTDSYGCVSEKTITVTQPDDIIISLDSIGIYANGFNISCNGEADGYIEVVGSGGTGSIQYYWNGPDLPNFTTGNILISAIAGNWEVVGTDQNGCIQNLFIDLTEPLPITIDFTTEPTSCLSQSDGSISIAVNGGTPNYSFLWSGPNGFSSTDEDIDNLVSGTYLLTITDSENCTKIFDIQIIELPEIELTLVGSNNGNGGNINCFGASNGTIDLTISGGTNPYSISWTGPNGFTSTNEDIENLIAGEYCATVTDTNGCSTTSCLELTQPDSIVFAFTTSLFNGNFNISCNGENDGSIATIVTGGVDPISIAWTGPNGFTSTNLNITNLLAGEYCASIVDGNGCTADTCITLTQPSPILIALVSPENSGGFNISCNEESDGSIESEISGGIAPYTYSWNGPNGFTANTQNIDSLSEGEYCLTITDTNGCTAIECITLTAPNLFDVDLITSSFPFGNNIDCSGNSTGFINSSLTGGIAPFTYSWIGPGGFTAFTENIENLNDGAYCLTVEDANQCTVLDCTILLEPSVLAIDPIIITPILCFGEDSATVDLNISGGTAPYQIFWEFGSEEEIVSNLGAGEYSVTITDTNNCSLNSQVVVTEPTLITASLTSPVLLGGYNITCYGDTTGSIEAVINGGTPPYTYYWTNVDSLSRTQLNQENLGAGEYCITVTDSNNCSIEECIFLTQPPAPFTALIFADGFINCDGSGTVDLSVFASGGVEPIEYDWFGGGLSANTETVENLTQGTYCVNLEDGNGCSTGDCINILPQPSYSVTFVTDGIDCSESDFGSINTEITGGETPFTYSWTGPGGYTNDTEDISGLTLGGIYCLTTSDATGCTLITCVTVIAPQAFDVNFEFITYAGGYNVSCNGLCDGEGFVSVSGGNENFTFEWIVGTDTLGTDSTITNLCAGQLLLITTDNIGCNQIDTINVTQPDSLIVNLTSPEYGGGFNISCNGDSTGAVFSEVTGGNPTYFYDWNGQGITDSTLAIQSVLTAGIYTLIVTDTNGCSASSQITLTEPALPFGGLLEPSVFPSGDNISCYGLCDGTLAFNSNGTGIQPFLYNWSYPDETNSDQPALANLCSGDYQLIVVDANECTYTGIINMSQPDSLITTVAITNEITCNGDNDGEITVTTNGGSPSFNFTWSPLQIDSNVISNLSGDNYQYLVTDINGCESNGELTLQEPQAIEVTAEVTNSICNSATGAIDVSLSGGSGNLNFVWDVPFTEQDLTNLLPGAYTITVTDSIACEQSFTFEVFPVGFLSVDSLISNNLCFGDSTGSINITLFGAEEPVTYQWIYQGSPISDSDDLQNLSAGFYSVSIIDNKGCTFNNTFEVAQPDSLYVEDLVSPVFSTGFNVSQFGAQDGIIEELEISGGSPPYDGYWQGPNGYTNETIETFSSIFAGIYTVTVIDANGCKYEKSIEVTSPFELELPNGISINGDGFNDYLDVHGLEAFPDNKLTIFNRWGNIVYEKDDYKNTDRWAGISSNNETLPDGTYFVIVNVFAIKRDLTGYLEIRK
jgi:large repetitive protein